MWLLIHIGVKLIHAGKCGLWPELLLPLHNGNSTTWCFVMIDMSTKTTSKLRCRQIVTYTENYVWRYECALYNNSNVIMGAISPASRFFTQPFVHMRINENIKAPRHWPLCGKSPGPVDSLHKWPITRKMFPFNDVIMLHGFVTGTGKSLLLKYRWGITHSLHKWPITRKMFPFNDVIMLHGFVTGTGKSLLLKYRWGITHLPLVPHIWSGLVQIMVCRLFGAKSLTKPVLDYCQWDP